LINPPTCRNKSPAFFRATEVKMDVRTPSSPIPATQSFWSFKEISKARIAQHSNPQTLIKVGGQISFITAKLTSLAQRL
jgi:hypothetical protein